MKKTISNLYISDRTYQALSAVIAMFALGYFIPVIFYIGKFSAFFVSGIFITDFILLFFPKRQINAKRIVAPKLSNGDFNTIGISIINKYPFKTYLTVIDEIPFQFQMRNFKIKTNLSAGHEKFLEYKLRPTERGVYNFGHINVYAQTRLKFIKRRFKCGKETNVKVYPSYLQLRKYSIMAQIDKYSLYGVRKIRLASHNKEFDEIRTYNPGDDFRTINWKATARSNKLMVNKYMEEKSQNIYSIIDLGRTMKMPFEEMTLLDYSINSSLVMSYIATIRNDKAGLLTFNDNIKTFVKASHRADQMTHISEALYGVKTVFYESNYELLTTFIRKNIPNRSLIMLYTNFETANSLQTNINYLKIIAKTHLLVVIFFQNSEIKKVTQKKVSNPKDIYLKSVAEKFILDKQAFAKQLQLNGILSLTTEPKNLTINTLNKYLELKTRGIL